MYNYIGIIHKPTAVSHSLKCNFTSKTNDNLILIKNNIIEIYNLTKNGLEPNPYLNIFGKIIIVENIPCNKQNKDNLFILTEDLDYRIISYNNNKIENLIKGNIKEDLGKKNEKILYAIDSNKNYIIINAYVNLFNVICLNINLRDKIRDFIFTYEYEEIFFLNNFSINHITNNNSDSYIYTFSIVKSTKKQNNNINNNLNNNNNNNEIYFETFQINVINKKIITYEDRNHGNLNFKVNEEQSPSLVEQVFGLFPNQPNNKNKKTLTQQEKNSFLNFHHKINLYTKPSLIITHPKGLIIIFYKDYVTFYRYNSNNNILENSHITYIYTNKYFNNYSIVNENSYKYLISDSNGSIYVLVIKNPFDEVSSLDNCYIIFQYLNEVNYPSCITHLNSDYFFVGSCLSNSQLIKVNDNKPFIQVSEEYESLAPITDLVVNSKGEFNEIITVSGIKRDCNIKNIQKGKSVKFEFEICLKGIKFINKLYYVNNSKKDLIDNCNYKNKINCFVISTFNNSLIFEYYNNNIKVNKKINLIKNEIIIFSNNFNEVIIIITNINYYLYDIYLNKIFEKKFKYKPLLIKFQKKYSFIFIYNNHFELNLYKIENNSINYYKNIFINDICSFDITENNIIYSLWNSNNIFIFNYEKKKNNILCNINEIYEYIYISSILVYKNKNKDNYKNLFLGLSNGKLIYYNFEIQNLKIELVKKINICTESFNIKKINLNNNKNVIFINSKTPCFVNVEKKNLKFSNFTIKNCNDILNLNLDNLFLFSFNNMLSFGFIQNSLTQNIINKTFNKHIQKIQILNFKNNKNLFIILYEENNKSIFSLNDFNLKEISNYKLENKNEISLSFCNTDLNKNNNDNKYILIGSSIYENELIEPSIGHIYLLEINNEFKINKISEITTNGGVYQILYNDNIIYCSIQNNLYIYSIEKKFDFFEIKEIHRYSDFVLINNMELFNNNELLISDLYKNIQLFKYDKKTDKLNEICKEYLLTWAFNITQCNNNIIYLTDINGNIISLIKTLYPKSNEEKYKFEKKAIFNFGERINKIINLKISKNIIKNLENITIFNKYNENEENNNDNNFYGNLCYFGSLEGTLGIIIQLNKELFEFLEQLQNIIIKKLVPNGNFEYNRWRSYKDGFINEDHFGFVEGEILKEFLNYNDKEKKDILKELNYPWQKNINDIVNIIQTLEKYH